MPATGETDVDHLLFFFWHCLHYKAKVPFTYLYQLYLWTQSHFLLRLFLLIDLVPLIPLGTGFPHDCRLWRLHKVAKSKRSIHNVLPYYFVVIRRAPFTDVSLKSAQSSCRYRNGQCSMVDPPSFFILRWRRTCWFVQAKGDVDVKAEKSQSF